MPNKAVPAFTNPSDVEVIDQPRITAASAIAVITELNEEVRKAVHDLQFANPMLTQFTYNMDGYRVTVMIQRGGHYKRDVNTDW